MRKQTLEELNAKLKINNPNLSILIVNGKYMVKCDNCNSIYEFTGDKISAFCRRNKKCVICDKGSRMRITENILKRKIEYLTNSEYELIGFVDVKDMNDIKTKEYIEVRHKECNRSFKTTLDYIIHGFRCPLCAREKTNKISSDRKIDKNEFTKRLKERTENTVKLNGDFNGIQNRCDFICNKGHEFNIIARHMLYDTDHCPECQRLSRETLGEKYIREYLENNDIQFTQYYKGFTDCVYKDRLEMDFYLEDLNTVIEFDGRFHYEPFKDDDDLIETQNRDNAKNEYCKNNGINMVRIPYWDMKYIEKILDRELVVQRLSKPHQ